MRQSNWTSIVAVSIWCLTSYRLLGVQIGKMIQVGPFEPSNGYWVCGCWVIISNLLEEVCEGIARTYLPQSFSESLLWLPVWSSTQVCKASGHPSLSAWRMSIKGRVETNTNIPDLQARTKVQTSVALSRLVFDIMPRPMEFMAKRMSSPVRSDTPSR